MQSLPCIYHLTAVVMLVTFVQRCFSIIARTSTAHGKAPSTPVLVKRYIREVQREALSGWFMVNAAAFAVMAAGLARGIISNVADYGYQNADLATGLFLGSGFF